MENLKFWQMTEDDVRRAAIIAAWRDYANAHTSGMMFVPPGGICRACGHDCTSGWTLESAQQSFGPSGCPRCHVSWCD